MSGFNPRVVDRVTTGEMIMDGVGRVTSGISGAGCADVTESWEALPGDVEETEGADASALVATVVEDRSSGS